MTSGADMIDSRVSRAEAVARTLEQAISEGTIQPGARLGTKDELRRRYGVASGTLNEAIRLLQIRGLVEARPGPGGGLFASSPSPSARLAHLVLGFREKGATASDCMVVRDALEPLVAADAARHAEAADVADLRAILAAMADGIDDAPEYLRASWELHRRMARISPNSVLASAYLTVLDFGQDRLEAARRGEGGPRAGARARGASLELHREIVEAIAAGDAERAAAAAGRPDPMAQLGALGPAA